MRIGRFLVYVSGRWPVLTVYSTTPQSCRQALQVRLLGYKLFWRLVTARNRRIASIIDH